MELRGRKGTGNGDCPLVNIYLNISVILFRCSDHPGVKTPQPPCPDEKTRKKYEEDCRIVTDPNGPFASCHDSIAPEKVFSNCIYDLCATDGDSSIKERNFASYTDDCLEEQGILKSWRAEGNFSKYSVVFVSALLYIIIA